METHIISDTFVLSRPSARNFSAAWAAASTRRCSRSVSTSRSCTSAASAAIRASRALRSSFFSCSSLVTSGFSGDTSLAFPFGFAAAVVDAPLSEPDVPFRVPLSEPFLLKLPLLMAIFFWRMGLTDRRGSLSFEGRTSSGVRRRRLVPLRTGAGEAVRRMGEPFSRMLLVDKPSWSLRRLGGVAVAIGGWRRRARGRRVFVACGPPINKARAHAPTPFSLRRQASFE